MPDNGPGRLQAANRSAHVHSPADGQGMNTGIQDAYNLGWKLAAVLRGAKDTLLDTYGEGPHPGRPRGPGRQHGPATAHPTSPPYAAPRPRCPCSTYSAALIGRCLRSSIRNR